MEWRYRLTSILEPFIHDFILEKRALGYKYEQNEYILHLFDEYCTERHLESLDISRDFLEDWLTQKKTEGLGRLQSRVSSVRQFLLYLLALGNSVYIPHDIPSASKKPPYILDPEELKAVFDVIDSTVPKKAWADTLRLTEERRVILRLIYSCGLRVSEACGLKPEDADFDSGTLTVRASKTHSERIVYLAGDTEEMCRDYLKNLTLFLGEKPVWLFPASDIHNHIANTYVDRVFREAWMQTDFYDPNRDHPTVHDLRYTFITRVMNRWVKEGEPLDVMMPYLVRYVGHTTFVSTHYYYELTHETYDIIRKKDSLSSRVIPKR